MDQACAILLLDLLFPASLHSAHNSPSRGGGEGENMPVRYITVVDFKGKTVTPDVVIPNGDYNIQVSRNGEYFRIYNQYTMNLVRKDGVLVYSLPINSFDESSSGYLNDDGLFIGFLGKWGKMVLVNQEGDVTELKVPKPKKVRAFDLENGLILSDECSLGYSCFTAYRIPSDILSDIHQKAGIK